MHFFIDGYNVMYHIQEFKKLSRDDAITKLVKTCIEYSCFYDAFVTVVFDTSSLDESITEKVTSSVTVIYTDKNTTADTMIEQFVYERKDDSSVYVVTNDNALKNMSSGCGALCVSVSQFAKRIDSMRSDLHTTSNKVQYKSIFFNTFDVQLDKKLKGKDER